MFIAFEGGDGVGKTTQSELLADRLRSAGHSVVQTRQPGGTATGGVLRSILLNPASGDLAPRTETLLYAADKAQHVAEVVAPALADGSVVITDRYLDSMLAYQGAGRLLELADVEWLGRWATADLRPDLTVLLDSEPAGMLHRLDLRRRMAANRDTVDRLESAPIELHQRARQHFLALAAADQERYLILDAGADAAQIADQVWQRVRRLLPGGSDQGVSD